MYKIVNYLNLTLGLCGEYSRLKSGFSSPLFLRSFSFPVFFRSRKLNSPRPAKTGRK